MNYLQKVLIEQHTYSLRQFQIESIVMDVRTQRYMQRIEQIMQSNKKGTPHRPSKSPISCKPNHLDTYLKYELSAKIIQKILNKNHQKLVQQFFNTIRITEYRQKEKIYRFIAIERSEHANEMWVDGAIVCKVLSTTLKGLIRKRYMDFIQCLQVKPQKYAVTPQKIGLNRKQSAKDASPISARMRTFTIASKFQRSSNHNLSEIGIIENGKNEEKMRDFAVKNIANIVKGKINKLNYISLYKISIQNAPTHIKKHDPTINEQENTKIQSLQLNIFKKSSSVKVMANIIIKLLSRYFNKIHKNNNLTSQNKRIAQRISKKISRVVQKFKFRLYNNFLSRIRSIKVINKSEQGNIGNELFLLQIRSKSKSTISNQDRSHINEASHVEPYNPLAKLNFYAFVDKIMKLILVLSKLLIPFKQAFTKIDHYASYAYRLQQSLKCVPHRILLEAFLQMKNCRRVPRQNMRKVFDKTQNMKKLHDLLYPLIKIRLIEGFTHIKIISKERDLKIKIFPAKQNIVELTKKFIVDRGQYTANSYQYWQQLKSSLLSTNSKENVKKSKSSIR